MLYYNILQIKLHQIFISDRLFCSPYNMEITSENFEEDLPIVKEAIEECLFMSMDFEMSGLFPHSAPNTTWFDSLQQRYENASQAAKTFIPIQFGLCTVSWNEEEKYYYAKTFNFFIHPFSSRKGYQFACDLSSLKFLSSHNFDFNKLFSKGLQFVSRQKQIEITENSNNNNQKTKERADIHPSSKDQEFIDESM